MPGKALTADLAIDVLVVAAGATAPAGYVARVACLFATIHVVRKRGCHQRCKVVRLNLQAARGVDRLVSAAQLKNAFSRALPFGGCDEAAF